jgi:Spy/CpxP family protein refolding chaperone
MKSRFSFVAVVACAASLFAQQHPPQDQDPIGRHLFPPELIMARSQDIGLQEKQRAVIKTEIQKAQAKFIDLQWDMKERSEKMERLLDQSPADEAKILEQADRVMGLEREIKRTQLTLLIRIKNSLTAEQVAKLETIRRSPEH